MRRIGVLAIVAFGTLGITVLCGCTKSELIGDEATGNVVGVAYHLPIDVLEVTVTETTTSRRQIGVNKDTRVIVAYAAAKKTREYALATRAVADTSRRFRLKLEPGSASADELTILVRPNGLLESINASSTGRAGEVLKNVASVVGTVAGAAFVPKQFEPGEITHDRAILEAEVAKILLATLVEFKRKHGASEVLGTAIDGLLVKQSISGLPRSYIYVLSKWDVRRVDWLMSLVLANQIERLSLRRAELFSKDAGALESEKAKAAVAAIDAGITKLSTERSARLAAIAAQATPVEVLLAPTVETKTYQKIIGIEKLPLTSEYEADKSKVTEEAKALRESAGIVVSVAGRPEKSGGTTSAGKKGNDPKKARIYYRQPVLLTFTTWVGKEHARLDDTVVDVVCAASPVHYLEFETNAFASRSLIVKFEANGRLRSVKRSSTSSAEAATAGVAASLTELQESIKASVTKSGEIVTARNKVEIDRMQHDVDVMAKGKAIVDARVALAGSSATEQLRIEQSTLAAKLLASRGSIVLLGSLPYDFQSSRSFPSMTARILR